MKGSQARAIYYAIHEKEEAQREDFLRRIGKYGEWMTSKYHYMANYIRFHLKNEYYEYCRELEARKAQSFLERKKQREDKTAEIYKEIFREKHFLVSTGRMDDFINSKYLTRKNYIRYNKLADEYKSYCEKMDN